MMNVVVEWLVLTGLTVYYVLEAIVLFFVPLQYKRKNVKGQRVLVTGAGSGLGRLLSQRFAKLGCTLILWDINEDANEDTASNLKELGASVYTYKVDLSKREEIYRAADKVKSDVGDIDILVNNAGIVTGKKFLECPDSLIQKTMDVNINAHFWTVKAFLPAMLRKNKGHVVSIASAAGYFGVNGLSDYCASKFAAVGFDESLRIELAAQKKTGISTTVVCPYYITTGMFDGVQPSRFPRILPFLDPNYVVDKIMDAVLTNQALLCIPRVIYFMVILKSLFPSKVLLMVDEFIGLSKSMDQFRGRGKSE